MEIYAARKAMTGRVRAAVVRLCEQIGFPLFGKFVFSWIKYLPANILIEKIYTVHVENLDQIFTPSRYYESQCSAIGQWNQSQI